MIRNGVLAMLASMCVALVCAANVFAAAGSQSAKACQKDGWESLVREDGSAFNNEGECVSYGVHGGVLKPKLRGQSVCAELGGTFSTTDMTALQAAFLAADGGTLIWTCNGMPVDFEAQEGQINQLGSACSGDGSNTFLVNPFGFDVMCFVAAGLN